MDKIEMPTYQGTDGGKHVVAKDWRVSARLPDGRQYIVDIYQGFAFDGCSIPRILWRLCGHPMEVPRVAAALAHDWLYASHAISRKTADQIFRALCVAVGVGRFRAAVEYCALRLFGWMAWRGHDAADNVASRRLGSLGVLVYPVDRPLTSD